jgi:hypothetical protein
MPSPSRPQWASGAAAAASSRTAGAGATAAATTGTTMRPTPSPTTPGSTGSSRAWTRAKSTGCTGRAPPRQAIPAGLRGPRAGFLNERRGQGRPLSLYQSQCAFGPAAANLEGRKRARRFQHVRPLENALPSFRCTTDPRQFARGMAAHCGAYDRLHAFYAAKPRQAERAARRILREKALHYAAQHLIFGEELRQARARRERAGLPPRLPPDFYPKIAVIGVGNQGFVSGSCISRHHGGAPIKTFWAFLERNYRRGVCARMLHFFKFDEFRTSERCVFCGTKLEKLPPGRPVGDAWRDKWCPTCSCDANRDDNAARNFCWVLGPRPRRRAAAGAPVSPLAVGVSSPLLRSVRPFPPPPFAHCVSLPARQVPKPIVQYPPRPSLRPHTPPPPRPAWALHVGACPNRGQGPPDAGWVAVGGWVAALNSFKGPSGWWGQRVCLAAPTQVPRAPPPPCPAPLLVLGFAKPVACLCVSLCGHATLLRSSC